MKLGIVGLPNVGKTTLFNALTHANAAATAYAYTSAESNRGVVPVPDERLDRLHEVLETPKKVYATIDVVDIAGLAEGASRGEGLGNRFLADIRGVDAVAHVIRTFANADVAHVRDAADPQADAELVETELVLGDLELAERRRDKTVKAARSGDKAMQRELETVDRLLGALREGTLARAVERSADDDALFRELALVSDRPVLFVLNTNDDQSADEALEHTPTSWSGRRRAATRWSPSPRASRRSSPTSTPTRRPSSAPRSALEPVARSTSSCAPATTCSATSPSSPATSAAASRAPGNCPAAGRPRRRRAASTATSSTGSCAPRWSTSTTSRAESFHAAREKALLRTEGKEYVVQDGDVINFLHTG